MEFDYLRAVSILRALSDEELTAFGTLLTVQHVAAGERILEEGTPVNAFYIVCSGVVHVRRLAQKREMLISRLGAGAFFGEINLFDPGVATASIYAMKTVTLAVVDYGTLHAFMEANTATGFKMTSGMMTELARRLRQTSSRLVNSAYWSSSDA